MTAIQPVLERAVAAGDLPYVVAMAARSDRILFQGACGAEADTVFRIYSMTKAIGALAAMLLIDRDLEVVPHLIYPAQEMGWGEVEADRPPTPPRGYGQQ